jgi:hypothetical protein
MVTVRFVLLWANNECMPWGLSPGLQTGLFGLCNGLCICYGDKGVGLIVEEKDSKGRGVLGELWGASRRL